MSTQSTGLRLSPQEALARDLIMERVAARHRADRRRHPSRAALLLRSIADRLDRAERLDHRHDADDTDGADRSDPGHSRRPTTVAGPHPLPAATRAGLHDNPLASPHAGQPRPWAATRRRAPHRHSS